MNRLLMIGKIAVLAVVMLVKFSSLATAGDLTEKQRDAILKAHPSCGDMIIFASMAEHIQIYWTSI